MNLYAYVENDPMNWVDVLGLQRVGDKDIVVIGDPWGPNNGRVFSGQNVIDGGGMFVPDMPLVESEPIDVTATRPPRGAINNRPIRLSDGLFIPIQGAPRFWACTDAGYTCQGNLPPLGPYPTEEDFRRQTQRRLACTVAQAACDEAVRISRADQRRAFIIDYPDGTRVLVDRGGAIVERRGSSSGWDRNWPPIPGRE